MTTERWTVKTLSGALVGEFIVETESVDPPKPALQPGNGGRPWSAASSGAASGTERMTEPQKRYLFRLLAAQKVEGRAAEEHLKRHFGVRALGDIGRQAASEYIDQLVKDRSDAAS